MSSELQKIQQLYRWNAALRHGIPLAALEDPPPTTPPTQSAPATNEVIPVTAPPQEPAQPSLAGGLMPKLALAAAIALGGASGGALLTHFLAPPTVTPEKSLLQDLEDRGFNRYEEPEPWPIQPN